MVLPGVCMVVITVVVMMVVVVVSSSRSVDAMTEISLSGDLLICAPDLSISAKPSVFTEVVNADGAMVVAMATLALSDRPCPMVTAILGVLVQGGGADVYTAVVRDSVVTRALCDSVVSSWSLIVFATFDPW